MSTSHVNLKTLCNAGISTALIPQHSGWGGFPPGAKTLNDFPVGE